MVYIVSYDQRSPSKSYASLYEELRKLSAKRIQASVWGVRSDLTANQIYDLLFAQIDSNDRLFVVPFDASTGSYKNYNGANKLADI